MKGNERRRYDAMLRIQQLADELEADGLIRTQGLLWFALIDLLMGEEITGPLMLDLAPILAKWQPIFAVWKEKEIERIKRHLKPEPGDALDEMIQKVSDWPEGFE